mmetsp:Transcript_26861/g.75422  ORF Transcript_26861/g.75422 Transcript_26861/m.75422 type:complete len:244 (+) Transcript_26861:431-1162(+)
MELGEIREEAEVLDGLEAELLREGPRPGGRAVVDDDAVGAHLFEGEGRGARRAAGAAEQADEAAALRAPGGVQPGFQLILDPQPIRVVAVELAIGGLGHCVHRADHAGGLAERVHLRQHRLLVGYRHGAPAASRRAQLLHDLLGLRGIETVVPVREAVLREALVVNVRRWRHRHGVAENEELERLVLPRGGPWLLSATRPARRPEGNVARRRRRAGQHRPPEGLPHGGARLGRVGLGGRGRWS